MKVDIEKLEYILKDYWLGNDEERSDDDSFIRNMLPDIIAELKYLHANRRQFECSAYEKGYEAGKRAAIYEGRK